MVLAALLAALAGTILLAGCGTEDGPSDSAVPAGSAESGSAAGTQPSATDGQSGNADVQRVVAEEESEGSWTFRVTVAHPDTGWNDYADGWDVVTPDGTVLKPDPSAPFTRPLLHPHEDEQPFTRSQGGVVVPEGVATVTVRAHDSRDGWGGRTVRVDLETNAGEGFEVIR